MKFKIKNKIIKKNKKREKNKNIENNPKGQVRLFI